MTAPLWRVGAGANRRHAPAASVRSDQLRLRGLLPVAGIAAALTFLVTAWWAREDPWAHPISRPHAQAGLQCVSCHRADDARPRCATCHPAHPSTRRGHQQASAAGELACADCHRVHQDFGGVAFEEGGARRFGPGASEPVALPEVRAGLRGVVPVIPLAVCARCHDPKAPQDPIGRCADASGTMSLCFDEHVAVQGATLGTQAGAGHRLPLWTAAREAVARAPKSPSPLRPDTGVLWGAVASIVFIALVTRALWARPPRRTGTAATPDVRPPERLRLPQIDVSTCLGCSACVDACPYDVLVMEDYVAKVARAQDCCGLTTCQERCPNGSLIVHDGEPIDDRPGVDESLQSLDVPGLYLAGDLTGMPLIRNAINQGAVAVRSVVASGRRGAPEALDLVIVGAGPAGLSAALQAKRDGLRFVVVEQGALAQSIAGFPRGKLVFDQPLSVPLIGELWLAESTKEELVRQWTRIVRSEALPIHTGHRVAEIVADPGGFWVSAAPAEGATVRFRAPSVVLAIGRRGTPRRLSAPVDASMEAHVFYSLADAGSFAQRRCVVVGLGDVAMEAALALSYTPGTTVTVVARGEDFARGKARNVAAMRAAEAAGRLQIRWKSAVEAVEPGAVRLSGAGEATVPADAVFVMIGSIAPWAFMQQIGIQRVGG